MSISPLIQKRIGSVNFKAFLLALLSSMLFAFSWPAIGQRWLLIFAAFLPLFWLHNWRINGFLTRAAFIWFTTLAFFLWNSIAVYFLFNIEEPIGVKMLSLFTPVLINTIWMSAVLVLFSRITRRSGEGIGLFFLISSWLAIEWVQHHWSLAFPWLTLGNVMAPHPTWIQWYSITGVAGGSLMVLLMNFGIYRITVGGNRSKWIWSGTALILSLPLFWSFLVTEEKAHTGLKTIPFTVVQPCLKNENEKFAPELAQQNLARSLQLVHLDTSRGIVVLPETSVFEPGKIGGPQEDLRFSGLWTHDLSNSITVQKLRDFISNTAVDGVVAGIYSSRFYAQLDSAPAFAYHIDDIDAGIVHYNSALLMDSSATRLRHKTMLVAGVERIPFAETLPVLNELALDLGGVAGSLGASVSPRTATLLGTSLGVQICYDSAFGWLANEMVRDGAEVLVIITNDSWWGNTPGHLQLLSFAQLRAIETGRAVVRSANSGISAFITPQGLISDQLPWNAKGAITSDVGLSSHLTFYSQWGDYIYLFAAICLPFVCFFGLFVRKKSQ